jgi:hypothetical protein
MLYSVALHHQLRPEADVSHSVPVPPGFPERCLMAYNKAKTILNRKRVKRIHGCVDFTVGYIHLVGLRKLFALLVVPIKNLIVSTFLVP